MSNPNSLWSRPGFLIRRLHQIQVAVFLGECADLDVTPVQWGMLNIVADNPGSSHQLIAEQLGIDRSNVANVVTRLVAKGWLTQKTSDEDRRRKEVSVTSEAKKLMRKVSRRAKRAQRQMFAPLSHGEEKQFITLLERIVHENNNLGRTELRLSN